MLKQFFEPESVALIGASTNPEKLGFKILKNLIDGGYKGKIFPVNPKAESILNLKCYKNVLEIPQIPELVIIAIPSKSVCEVVEDCGRKGVKGIIVISAGFKETGEEGKKREERLKEIVKEYNMRLIGPNCLGVIDTGSKLNASFAMEMPPEGKIGFITQSGALGTAILDWAIKENIGLSKFISVGNMADVSETDLIEELGEDENTNVILLYLEGISNGRKFIEVAKKVSDKKPIIVVKSGRTTAGSEAASSHTGSLAGSDKAFDAAFKQSKVIRAETVQELFDYALIFSFQPLIKGEKIAIITNAGGPSVMAVDCLENVNLELSSFSSLTTGKLKNLLPPASSIKNPADVLGDADAERYGKAMEIILSDENVDGLLAILTPQVVTQIPETAEKIVEISRRYNKPVVTSFMGGKRMEEGVKILMKNRIPNYFSPERAVLSLKAMSEYRKNLEEKKKEKMVVFNVEKEKVMKKIEEFKRANKKTVGDIEGREILSFYGIPTISSYLVKNLEECRKVLEKIEYPVVMKIVSPDIIHKTEANGVKVGIKNMEEGERSFEEILSSAKKYKPDARITGIQIQPLIEKSIEVIVGVSKDVQFGHLIMFGIGGIFVELLKDVSFRIIPITDVDAEKMIHEIKLSKILKGFRNLPPADIDSIKEILLRVSQLISDFPEIVEMDINPLMVRGKDAVAVDVRFVFDF